MLADWRATVATRGRRRDLLVLGGPPAIMVAIVLLAGESTRRELGFSLTEPTLQTAYLSHFVHLELAHLAGNVLSYVVLGVVLYLACLLADRRRFFWRFTLAVLVGFPFVLSGLNLAFERTAVAVGASGLTMALLGGMPVALSYVLDEYREFRPRLMPVLFLPSVLVIIIVGVPLNRWTALTMLGTGLLWLWYLLTAVDRYGLPTRRAVGKLLATGQTGEITALGAVLLVGYPITVFTGEGTDGAIANHYVHLLGFTLAFLTAFIADQMGITD